MLILDLRILDGLPLHIARAIRAACAQRLDVVHNVARTGAAPLAGDRTGVKLHELDAGRMAARSGLGAGHDGPEQQENADSESGTALGVQAPVACAIYPYLACKGQI